MGNEYTTILHKHNDNSLLKQLVKPKTFEQNLGLNDVDYLFFYQSQSFIIEMSGIHPLH